MNKISVFVLAIIFLMSVTGVVIYQAYCSCTGTGQVSLYVSPETCEDEFHVHHTHQDRGEEVPSCGEACHECSDHTNGCGCNDMDISFFKLTNEIVHEKVRTDTKEPVVIIKPEVTLILLAVLAGESSNETTGYIEPPSNKNGLDFLIHIHQLKIPSLA